MSLVDGAFAGVELGRVVTIERAVGGLVRESSRAQGGGPFERRGARREPFVGLVHLTPCDAEGQVVPGEPVVAAGKDLSDLGLSFFHPQPLLARHLIASIEAPDGGWIGLLLDVNRCRSTRHGWYESAGRIKQLCRSPLSSK